MSGHRLSRWAASSVAVTAILAVLVSALTAGIRIPGLGFLRLFSGGRSFDYSKARYSGFASLKDEFIKAEIGPMAAFAQEGSVRPRYGLPSRFDPDDKPRTTIEHPPTNDEAETAREVSSVPGTEFQIWARDRSRGAS